MIETSTIEPIATETTIQTTQPTASDSKPKSDASSTPIGAVSRSYLVAQVVSFLLSTIIIRSFWDFEDASRALAFYGVYHRYGWNQVIHFFGVPGIIWSLMVFLVHIPISFVHHDVTSKRIPSDESKHQHPTTREQQPTPPPLNYAGFLAISYNIFYLSIDPLGSILYAPAIYTMYASAVALVDREQRAAAEEAAASSTTTTTPAVVPWYGTGTALKIALTVHVLCWYAQIHLGHKIIEGAQPAVLESLGGALSVAPLFAFYEGLWMLGINKGLQESTTKLVEEYTLELCSQQGVGAMKACLSP